MVVGLHSTFSFTVVFRPLLLLPNSWQYPQWLYCVTSHVKLNWINLVSLPRAEQIALNYVSTYCTRQTWAWTSNATCVQYVCRVFMEKVRAFPKVNQNQKEEKTDVFHSSMFTAAYTYRMNSQTFSMWIYISSCSIYVSLLIWCTLYFPVCNLRYCVSMLDWIKTILRIPCILNIKTRSFGQLKYL